MCLHTPSPLQSHSHVHSAAAGSDAAQATRAATNIRIFIPASPDLGRGRGAWVAALVDAASVSRKGPANNEKALAECYCLSLPGDHAAGVGHSRRAWQPCAEFASP